MLSAAGGRARARHPRAAQVERAAEAAQRARAELHAEPVPHRRPQVRPARLRVLIVGGAAARVRVPRRARALRLESLLAEGELVAQQVRAPHELRNQLLEPRVPLEQRRGGGRLRGPQVVAARLLELHA